MMLDGNAAALDKHLSTGVDAPQCDGCGWTLGTFWDTGDHGEKVLVIAEQSCPECGKHYEERP